MLIFAVYVHERRLATAAVIRYGPDGHCCSSWLGNTSGLIALHCWYSGLQWAAGRWEICVVSDCTVR